MAGAGTPVFDAEQFARVCEDDIDFQREIIGDFLAQLDQRLEELAATVASRDAQGVHRAGHALKGSASTLGALALAAASTRLESLGIAADLSGAGSALEQVREEAFRLRAALDGYLRDRAA